MPALRVLVIISRPLAAVQSVEIDGRREVLVPVGLPAIHIVRDGLRGEEALAGLPDEVRPLIAEVLRQIEE